MSDEKKGREPANELRCPDCHCRHLPVVKTRHRDHPPAVIRYRSCRNCGRRIRTIEQIA